MNRTSETILPPFLKKGDTIAIVAPAGPVRNEAEFRHGLQILTEMGFRTRYRPDILRQEGYLAGNDQQRLAELHDFWQDQEVRAIMAVRGGYGCLRLLPKLDLGLIQGQPKMLIGFSDLTVLLCAVEQQTGLVTFHGPMLTTLGRCHRDSLEALGNLLLGKPQREIRTKTLEILRNGQARGRLLVGNLTCLTHLIGTPFEPDWRNRIVVLEDISEAPYRIDRLLTQLKLAGRLEEIAGLVLGSFAQCGDDVELIWNRALELLADQAIPVWANFPVGHGSNNLALPTGIMAEMDGAGGRLLLNYP